MGELKSKMLHKMELRNFSRKTITIYLYHMQKLVKYYKKSPENICRDEIEKYLHHLLIMKTSSSGMAQAYSSIKYFYCEVLNRNWELTKIPRPRTEKKLPVILSTEEVKEILATVKNLRNKVILMTLYSSGMRLAEGTHLKIQDIDRMEIRVVQGKGKKDRYTILSGTLLKNLRTYYKIYKPQYWLFPGKNNKPLNSSCVQKAFQEAKKSRDYQTCNSTYA